MAQIISYSFHPQDTQIRGPGPRPLTGGGVEPYPQLPTSTYSNITPPQDVDTESPTEDLTDSASKS
jgi:hypothetical protein